MARFECTGRRVNTSKEKEVYLELIKTLDKLENDKAPKVQISNLDIDFNLVRYKQVSTATLSLKNVGTAAAKWRFIKKETEDPEVTAATMSKSWVQLEPALGVLMEAEVQYHSYHYKISEIAFA